MDDAERLRESFGLHRQARTALRKVYAMGEFEQASSSPFSLSVRRISRALSIRSDSRDASQLVRSTCGVPRRTVRQVRCQVLDVRENTLNGCVVVYF